MIQDKDTNIVYLSKRLKEWYSDFFNRFTKLMDVMSIHWELLNYTRDVWVRDFMPIQLNDKEFIKYRYYPDYLRNSKDKRYITNCKQACQSINVSYKEIDYIIDGGNIVPCGNYLIMTNKVFAENNTETNDIFLRTQLEKIFGRKIIFIPWHKISEDEPYGHADGFIKWCGKNKILMSNHRETDPVEAAEIRNILDSNGFEITEMIFNIPNPSTNWNWAYINFLQVQNKIIMPLLGIPEDKQAQKYIQTAFPDCEVRGIRMRDIAGKGGALHCITWNIKQ